MVGGLARRLSSAAAPVWWRDPLLGVTTVDTGFPLVPTAAYVIGHCHLAVVAGGSSAAAPRVLGAVEAGGHRASDVRWIVLPSLAQWWSIPTLLASCPNATVLAHPRACRHLSAPRKLVGAELAAYGSAGFKALHGGEAEAYLGAPVPREQIRPVAAEDLPWPTPGGAEAASADAGWSARFLHGRGHTTDGELCFVLVRKPIDKLCARVVGPRADVAVICFRCTEPRQRRWSAWFRRQLPWGRIPSL